MRSFSGVELSVTVAQVDIVQVVVVLRRVVLLVEFVENPDGLAFREDTDRFDWVAAEEVPSTFFWSAVLAPGLVDGDGRRLFLVLAVGVVPVDETLGALEGSFLLPSSECVH